MAKRFFPHQPGQRKRARLDISISDHNFPLSQNPSTSKEANTDNWGDDNDDEILLLASQACEQAYTNDSMLPDYSLCMKPSSTSTQMFLEPAPSTSKPFNFKKPSYNSPSAISTQLKDKCGTIASPLPGIAMKTSVENNFDNEDFIFNDKAYTGEDNDYVYRQLLQLKEENAKLKSENCKLSEKCVTKDGEVSILRTQLKSSQVAVDNARMERMKAQEKVQSEWNDKLSAVNNQAQDLRNQLDFKNMEIISIKEKCKMLESSKVKLTQVTVAGHDAYRNNTSHVNDFASARRVKVTTSSVQTESNAHFIKLNKALRIEKPDIEKYLPYILEQTTEHQTLLHYNEKLHKTMHSAQNRCKVINNIQRTPSTPFFKGYKRVKHEINYIYEDLKIVFGHERIQDFSSQYFNVLDKIKDILTDVENELEFISKRLTTAFQREMDEKYIEYTNEFRNIKFEDLLSGKLIHKNEQGTVARRVTAFLSLILRHHMKCFIKYEETKQENNYISILCKICTLLDSASCAVLYSGLLQAINYMTSRLLTHSKFHTKLKVIVKNVITSRPMYHVTCQTLRLLSKMALVMDLTDFCPKSNIGNLKTDYEQGVLLYKKDSCLFQVLLKQIEAALKCIERQRLKREAVEIAQDLIHFHSNSVLGCFEVTDKSRCDCRHSLLQVIVYSLNICAGTLKRDRQTDSDNFQQCEVISTCRSGVKLLYQCVIRDVEFITQLTYNEGHFIQFAEIMKDLEHGEVYGNMLTELISTFQAVVEDTSPSYISRPWMKSFQTLSMVD